jgi:hypothetical protein
VKGKGPRGESPRANECSRRTESCGDSSPPLTMRPRYATSLCNLTMQPHYATCEPLGTFDCTGFDRHKKKPSTPK